MLRKVQVLVLLSALTALVACETSPPAIDKPLGEKTALQLPDGFSYEVLFSEGDTVWADKGVWAQAKGSHDYNGFIPLNDSGTYGYLYVGHECIDSSNVLGDGGGATLLEVRLIGGRWKVLSRKNMDFDPVGGTFNNCGGEVTPWGTVLSAEEFPAGDNASIYKKGKGYRDTSVFKVPYSVPDNASSFDKKDLTMVRYLNTGWVVESDPKTGKALRKLYGMGRYSHEGIQVMPDQKTVYLTDDAAPCVFFKFVADKAGDLSRGQLYAYKQSADGLEGSWITLPMQFDSLANIRQIALRMGATYFIRMEWLTLANGKLYITETGMDELKLEEWNTLGGKPAMHLNSEITSKGKIYPHGSVLVFDPEKNGMQVFLAGGLSADSQKRFSNPDCIRYGRYQNVDYLMLHEDLVGCNQGRSNPADGECVYRNEAWMIKAEQDKPRLEDLNRLLVAPLGSETTGGCFSPDGKTYFLNIQHPDTSNAAPFNKSVTIAIYGF